MKELVSTILIVIVCCKVSGIYDTILISGGKVKVLFELYNESSLRNRLILPADYEMPTDLPPLDRESDIEVALQITGENRDSHHGAKMTGSTPGMNLEFITVKTSSIEGGKEVILIQEDQSNKLIIESVYQFYDGLSTIRRFTRIKNNNIVKIGIEYASSAMINNIGNLGPGIMEEKMLIHWAYSSWKSESQWRSSTPSEIGWANTGKNQFQLTGIFHDNLGSWSTIKELPMAVIENKEAGLSWYFQIEHNGSWHWEMSDVRSKANQNCPAPTYIYMGGPDEDHHHAWKELNPNEIYETVPVAIGCVEGGFEQAIAELTRYRRGVLLKQHVDNENLYVIFNDYMNCLWGNPSTEVELPLIRAAADLGCDIYVIDAGWYAEMNENWWSTVGVWKPSESRWPSGINEVIDTIKINNMIPGLWLEIERVGMNSILNQKPDSWFFMRHGKRVIENQSLLLDFRNPEVRQYADDVINRIVQQYGIGYIKMDYNINALMGTDSYASSPGQGLLEHNRAYLRWLDGIYQKYPGLIIENCGSGGCRMDYAMLSRYQLQSSSDQTNYLLYPSIIVGAMAAVLPEQLSAWSYPHFSGDADEASFNMVNGMLCRIHQSGHINNLNAESRKQVRDGIEVYKREIRPYLKNGIPIFPLGMPDINDHYSPVALGLDCEDINFISVWRLLGEDNVTIQLPDNQKAELIYPTNLGIKIYNGNKSFTVTFPRTKMAAIVKTSIL